MESSLAILRRADLSWEDRVAYLAHTLKMNGGVSELPVRHLFRYGQYVREMLIPPRTLFIGRKHLKGHQMILARGELQLFTERGMSVHSAPDEMTSTPGFYSVLYTLTSVIGVTVHDNVDNLHDVDKLESEIFEPAELLLSRGEHIAQRLLT